MQLPTLVLCLKPVKTQFKYKYNATKKHEYTTRQHPATTVLTNTPLQHPATTAYTATALQRHTPI